MTIDDLELLVDYVEKYGKELKGPMTLKLLNENFVLENLAIENEPVPCSPHSSSNNGKI